MVTSRVYLKFLIVIGVLAMSITCAVDGMTMLSKKIMKRSGSSNEYPSVWAKIDVKPVIDNERLYQKYKQCLVTNNTKGCPRMVMQFKAVLPEMVETMCSKCSPDLIKQIKRGVEYVCLTRRADYEQVARENDPEAKVRKAFQEKYGHVNC